MHKAADSTGRSHVSLATTRRTWCRWRPFGSGRAEQADDTTQELRATMVFRLEAGVWKIVHRHADTQTLKAALR